MVVPEPSTYATVALGVAGLLLVLRRRRARAHRLRHDERHDDVHGLEISPAVTYSPTDLRLQYHRRWRA